MFNSNINDCVSSWGTLCPLDESWAVSITLYDPIRNTLGTLYDPR